MMRLGRRARIRTVVAATLVVAGSVATTTGNVGAAVAHPRGLRAIPATALFDRQRIELRGEGLGAYKYFTVTQCLASDIPTSCSRTSSYGYTDASGNLSTTILVRRILTTGSTSHDCAVVRCVAYLGASVPSLRLAFDPTAPKIRSALPAQPRCVAWPTAKWPTAPIPAGVNVAAVRQAGNAIIASGATSVLVIHSGQIVYEKYAPGYGPTTIEPSFSMSKSFASTVIGLLAQHGKLHLDARAPIREWAGASDPRRAITLRNILNMSSGLQWNEIYADVPDSDVMQMVLREPDQAAYVIAKSLAHAPGTYWNYSTGDTAILGRIIANTAGVSGATYEHYLHKVLFDPLGINPVYPAFDQSGTWGAGWFTNTTTRNFAKLGYLYLRNGVWAGRQFLAPSWVEFVRTPSPASSGYGGQFWLEADGSFRMVGLYGQSVHIVPDSDLIVAVNNGGGTGAMEDLFRHAARPACGTTPAALKDDTATVTQPHSVAVPVLRNDTGGTVGLAVGTLTVSRPPHHGAAAVVNGTIRYTPARGFHGTDAFSYVVCTRDRVACLEASVAVTVNARDRVPI